MKASVDLEPVVSVEELLAALESLPRSCRRPIAADAIGMSRSSATYRAIERGDLPLRAARRAASGSPSVPC